MTLLDSRFAKRADQFRVRSFSLVGLKKFLKKAAKVTRESKEDQPLFLLTTFIVPEGAKSFRTKDHIHAIYGLVLDFDGGTLSKEEFVRIFWTNATRHRSAHS
jgi:hypothetical protein